MGLACTMMHKLHRYNAVKVLNLYASGDVLHAGVLTLIVSQVSQSGRESKLLSKIPISAGEHP